MCGTAIFCTILAWIVGLFLDANTGFSDPYNGFLMLRVLFPMLTMGGFILYRKKENQ